MHNNSSDVTINTLVDPILEYAPLERWSSLEFDRDLYGHYSFDDEALACVICDGKFGYIDRTGTFIIHPMYDDAYAFTEGLACVKKDNYFGYIDRGGNTVIPFTYVNAYPFSEGFAVVCSGINEDKDKWGPFGIRIAFINKTGDFMLKTQYYSATPFRNGLSFVRGRTILSGFIDISGKMIIPNDDDNMLIPKFSEELAVDERFDKWGAFDKNGETVIPFEYDYLSGFCNGLAIAANNEYESSTSIVKHVKYGLLNKNGDVIIPLEYDGAGDFSDGLIPVKKNEKWGFISSNNDIAIPFDYDFASSFSSGLARVIQNNSDVRKHSYINMGGDTVFSFESKPVKYPFGEHTDKENYDGLFDFNNKNGLALYVMNGKMGILEIDYGRTLS